MTNRYVEHQVVDEKKNYNRCEMLDSHSGTAEDSSRLACYAVSLGKYFPTFRDRCDFMFRVKLSKIDDDVTTILGNVRNSLLNDRLRLL